MQPFVFVYMRWIDSTRQGPEQAQRYQPIVYRDLACNK